MPCYWDGSGNSLKKFHRASRQCHSATTCLCTNMTYSTDFTTAASFRSKAVHRHSPSIVNSKTKNSLTKFLLWMFSLMQCHFFSLCASGTSTLNDHRWWTAAWFSALSWIRGKNKTTTFRLHNRRIRKSSASGRFTFRICLFADRGIRLLVFVRQIIVVSLCLKYELCDAMAPIVLRIDVIDADHKKDEEIMKRANSWKVYNASNQFHEKFFFWQILCFTSSLGWWQSARFGMIMISSSVWDGDGRR